MMYEISNVEKIYPNWYDKNSTLSREDQKWIWENIPLPEDKLNGITDNTENKANESVSLIRSVNGTYKHKEDSEQNITKRQAISRLKHLNYRTPAKEIASCLNIIFERWEKKPDHWLYISQTYTPKTI